MAPAMKSMLEDIFYAVSIGAALITALFVVLNWGFQTTTNASDIRTLQAQYDKIMFKLVAIEQAVNKKEE